MKTLFRRHEIYVLLPILLLVATTRNHRTLNAGTTGLRTLNPHETSNSSSVSSLNSPLPPLPPFPWQWIHPRKTGTSFGNALYMLACPEAHDVTWQTNPKLLARHSMHPQWGLVGANRTTCRSKWTHGYQYTKLDRGNQRHLPIRRIWWMGEHARRNTTLSTPQLFVTVREPVARIVSHLMHMGSLQRYRKRRDNHAVPPNETLVARHVLKAVKEHSRMTSHLFPPERAASLDTAEACHILQDVTWVGVLERFQQSICLLHARFDFPHHPAELVNMRPQATNDGGRGKKKIALTNTTTTASLNISEVGRLVRLQTTLLDDELYQCAMERFNADLQRYAPHCS